MIEVRWTLEAYEDLKGIRDYIGRDSTVYARDVASHRYDAGGVLAPIRSPAAWSLNARTPVSASWFVLPIGLSIVIGRTWSRS